MSITIEQAISFQEKGIDVVINDGKISNEVYKQMLDMEKAIGVANLQPSQKNN